MVSTPRPKTSLRKRAEKLKTNIQLLTKKSKSQRQPGLKPKLLVDIEYRALTGTGKLRHPFFKGIREDL
jgi:bifunctional non-homologous end joining protein LigD